MVGETDKDYTSALGTWNPPVVPLGILSATRSSSCHPPIGPSTQWPHLTSSCWLPHWPHRRLLWLCPDTACCCLLHSCYCPDQSTTLPLPLILESVPGWVHLRNYSGVPGSKDAPPQSGSQLSPSFIPPGWSMAECPVFPWASLACMSMSACPLHTHRGMETRWYRARKC